MAMRRALKCVGIGIGVLVVLFAVFGSTLSVLLVFHPSVLTPIMAPRPTSTSGPALVPGEAIAPNPDDFFAAIEEAGAGLVPDMPEFTSGDAIAIVKNWLLQHDTRCLFFYSPLGIDWQADYVDLGVIGGWTVTASAQSSGEVLGKWDVWAYDQPVTTDTRLRC